MWKSDFLRVWHSKDKTCSTVNPQEIKTHKGVGVSLNGVFALCFPGYINITQQSLFLLFSWRFVSFTSEWIFMVSCNCHHSNSGIAVIRRARMLEDEALIHGRLLPKSLHLHNSTLNSWDFLLFVSLSLLTDQY